MALAEADREAVVFVIGRHVGHVFRKSRQRLGAVRTVGADFALGVGIAGLDTETFQRRPKHIKRNRHGQFKALQRSALAVGRRAQDAVGAARVIDADGLARTRRRQRVTGVIPQNRLIVDIRQQVLVEVSGAHIAFVAGIGGEVFFIRQIEGVGQPGLQFRVAAAAGPDRAGQGIAAGLADADIEAGTHVVHTRAGHLARCGETDILIGRQAQTQVQAWQEIAVAVAVGGQFAGRGAIDDRNGGRTLVDFDELEADVAAQAHGVADIGIDVGLHEEGLHLLVDFPVLAGDVLVVLADQVVEPGVQQGAGIEDGQTVNAAEAEAAGRARERRGIFHAARIGAVLDAELVLVGALLFGAVGEVVAEFDTAQEAFIEGTGGIQTEGLDIILDLESLVVAVLAPVAGVDQLEIVRIVKIRAEGEVVVKTAGIQGDVERGTAVPFQAGVGFQHIEIAGRAGHREIGGNRPVVVDLELVVPAEGEQRVLDRIAVHTQHRLHIGPGTVGNGAVAVDGVARLQHARTPGGAVFQTGLDFGLVELGVEQVQRGFVEFSRFELHRGHQAVALQIVVELVDLAAANDFGAARTIGITPGFILVARARAVEMGVADRDAEGVVHELVDVGEAVAAAVFGLAGDFVLVEAVVQRQDLIAEAQRFDGLQIDGTGQTLADQGGVRGFIHGYGAEQLGRVLIELDAAVVAEADLFAAVEGGAGEVTGETADIDLGGTATFALGGQAGQTRDGFGNRRVRQFADVFGGNRFDDARRGLFGVDGVLNTAADAPDGHLVDGFGIGRFFGGFRFFSIGRFLGMRGSHQQHGGRHQCNAEHVALKYHYPSP